MGLFSGIAVFLKAMGNLNWGFGFLFTLILLAVMVSPIVSVLLNSFHTAGVSIPEGAIGLVDFSLTIRLVALGVVVGIVLFVVRLFYRC